MTPTPSTRAAVALVPPALVEKAAMLTLNNVEVIYDEVILVLRGLSLTVPEGQIVALLGSNGAGKSTTLKAVSGLLPTEHGEVTDGQILLLENTRFLGGEEKNDQRLARGLSQLGDLYVNDAFGAAHRAHASTEGVAHHLSPAVAGLLMEKELAYLQGALETPLHPFVAILGGSKISGKIDVIEALLPKVDALLVGGAMACTFYKAMGLETGTSLVEPERVEMAGELLEKSGTRLILPHDATVSTDIKHGSEARAVQKDKIPASMAMLDIGPRTAESYSRAIVSARPERRSC